MIDTLRGLLAHLRIEDGKWDLLMVGDGSGSKWNNPGGWAVTLIVQGRHSGQPHYLTPFVGGVNRGPINWLEAMPYWLGIRHHYYDMEGRKLCQTGGGVEVHIVTDSEWTVRTMSGEFKADTHADMVSLFTFFEAKGYRIHWHHMKRDTLKLNSMMDTLSVNAREYMSAIELPKVSDEFPEFNVNQSSTETQTTGSCSSTP